MYDLRTFIAIGLTLALSSPCFAGDKLQSTMVDPGGAVTGVSIPPLTGPLGGGWTNGVSKGKFKGDDKCKVQVLLKGVALPDSDGIPGTGDEVICVADQNVTVQPATALSTSAVLRGEIKSGAVKVKIDLFAEGVGCFPSKKGGPALSQYDARVACYAPDGAYPAPPIGFASDATQGVYAGFFAPRPASALIATQGIYFLP